MSLLYKFIDRLNRVISVYPRVLIKDEIGQMVETFPTASATNVKCLILLRSQKYNQFAGNEVEYLKSTHKVRLEIGPTISVADRIKDENNIEYNVKFVHIVPSLNWSDDHLLLLVDIIE